jgi:hypothetical protein
MRSCWFAVSLFALVACKDATGKQADPVPADKVESAASGSAVTPQVAQANAELEEIKKDTAKGDQEDNEWTPAEHKEGMARWKDVGVYLDGKPMAFLTFGELPITLKPTWVKDKVSQDKPPNCPECPAWKWSQQRFYKFTDLLKSLGIDPRKVKTMHVYGSRLTQSVVASGKDLMTKQADQFMFRFGMDVAGKPLPWIPEGFGNGKTPDKIAGVMIYIDRKAPMVVRDEGIVLDGELVTGVPYYGEPIRGGIRIYLDDKLATIIKRQELDPKAATKTKSGELEWRFGEFLKSKGVDATNVVEGWVIRDERRTEKIPFAELEKMMFAASSQAKGGITLGGKLRANAIALHTRPIKDDELPKILPEEEW